jgi:uncharacterized protein
MLKNKIKIQKSVQIALIISVAAIILASMIIGFFVANSLTNTIAVNGEGIKKVMPDLVSIYFNIETKGDTSKEADDANSVVSNKLTDYVMALGFKEEDLGTESYNIYPDYDYTTGKNRGYRAVHTLKISFSSSKKDKITSVIDAGTNAGAGISYINFELSPELTQQYKSEAIKAASEDAKVKAESIASGFSKNLGRLVSVSLDSFNYYPFRVYDSTASSAPSAESAKTAVAGITPSQQDVTAYVKAVYKLN